MKNISHFLAAYILQDSFLPINDISMWEISYFLFNNIFAGISFCEVTNVRFFVSIMFLRISEKLSNFLFKYVYFGGSMEFVFQKNILQSLLCSFSQLSNFPKIHRKFAHANIAIPKNYTSSRVSKILVFKDIIFV